MLAAVIVVVLQAAPVPTQQARPAASAEQSGRDSTRAAKQLTRDSVRALARARRDSIRVHREPKRVPVTAEHLATAFRDSAARPLLLLARQARMRLDSSLASYDATTYQRISVGLAFTRFGRDRLAFRTESATRVQWRRDVGAYVDVTGSRTAIPIAGKSAHVDLTGDITPIPYYPGSETMWIGSSAAREAVDENEGVVNPLAAGSEAYYTFKTGDSATFRLPDGHAIRLRELQVRPRAPKWNLAVGSLWFDLDGGHLVRAAYRMSVPMDIKAVAEEDDPKSFEDVPTIMKPLMFPMTASISAIGVEYGLYQGRFWLPRLQVMEGNATAGFMHIPMKLEQKYTYEHVNSGAPLPKIEVAKDSARTQGGTTVEVTVGSGEHEETVREDRRARNKAQCDSIGVRTRVRTSRGNPNPVLTRIPCDSTRLANSPDLPPSIYDKGEETFGAVEMDALVTQALSMGAQADFAPLPPHAELQNFRYNRVEGISGGARIDQELGAGYSLHATGRIGIADWQPAVELFASRSDLRRTLSVGAYNRLVSAGDWGNPLSLGSSISALLFGRDEGFYYRASGLELTSVPDGAAGGGFLWSLFAEQQRTAVQKTTFSFARVTMGSSFEPNLTADKGVYVGARARHLASMGLDPEGFRLLSDVRLEAARGDTGSYARAAADLTASHGIGDGAAALTLAAGTSAGALPAQRFWFLKCLLARACRVGARQCAPSPGAVFGLRLGRRSHGVAEHRTSDVRSRRGVLRDGRTHPLRRRARHQSRAHVADRYLRRGAILTLAASVDGVGLTMPSHRPKMHLMPTPVCAHMYPCLMRNRPQGRLGAHT